MARCLILAIGPTTVLDLLDYANNGLLVTLKDTGAPAVREVIQDIPTMDGTGLPPTSASGWCRCRGWLVP